MTGTERHRPDGSRVSALRFAADGPYSPLQSGSGYWRYVPEPASGTVRFITGYDYRGWPGPLGALVDRWCVRPLTGWLTAWSFDRLRLWAERGITPEESLARACAEVSLRLLPAALCLFGAGRPLLAAAVLPLTFLPPPLPTTPAARRCVRRPRARHDVAAPPRALLELEGP
ncbi:hypothetical protein [Kitasatospora sp. NPDC057223]|uniref:hypothetical protein n=1 Tax=Kitasatospora sp. NPDC057223 TaxID=3346055 RepID=UPI0036320715